MYSNESGYNRRVKIVDFLYLSTLLYGFSQFYSIKLWIAYPIFFIISYSIVLDWRSAVAMANTGRFMYMVFDLLTIFNYFGLVNNLLLMNDYNSRHFKLFIFHYALVFFIYVAWNIAILISNKKQTNKRTKSFFNWFNVMGGVAFLLCLACILQGVLYALSVCGIITIVIVILSIHTTELLIWTYKTYLKKDT